jgi:hypothetical protein
MRPLSVEDVEAAVERMRADACKPACWNDRLGRVMHLLSPREIRAVADGAVPFALCLRCGHPIYREETK